MIEIASADLDLAISGPELCIVQFYIDGCKPCRLMHETLEYVEKKCQDAEVFVSFFITHAHGFQERFNFSGYPTVIAFRDQAERARLTGGKDRIEVENWLVSCLK